MEETSTQTRLPERDLADVMGIRIDRLTMEQTVERVVSAIEARTYVQHVCINAAKLVQAHEDPELRDIIDQCGIVNGDGQAIVWAAKLLKDPLPERVAGVDLMFELFALAEQRGYRPYILGAQTDVLDCAVQELRKRHPRIDLAGYRNGYFKPEEAAAVAEDIRASRADILFVAMSSPGKERFLAAHGASLGVPFVMGVGGSIDILAGVTQRAPAFWRKCGLEWLYRMLQEPRRLFKRYAVTNTKFLVRLARTLAARR